MFKRANKITALLVAAASVMSIVPAMAADTTRLGTKEGTIENAVAFGDGKYVYEGYKTNSDDKSVYYNAGDKDKELTALTDSDLQGSYSDKYAFAVDGSDEYLVDLTDGKVIDDETPEDKEDTAATKLKTALKKTDRYGDSIAVTDSELTRLSNAGKFGDTWYQYAVSPTDGDLADNDVAGVLYGYTDGSGKYIDASNVANVYAFSTAKQKVVKIENFSNKANDEDSDTKLQATLTAAPEFLAQDKEYIYQRVSVDITDTAATGTTSDSYAKVTIDFPTSTSDVAFTGSREKLTIRWEKIDSTAFAAAGTVVIAGQTFTYNADPDTTLNQYKDLATLKTAVATTFQYGLTNDGAVTITPALATAATATANKTYTYSNGVFTATAVGSAASKLAAAPAFDTIVTYDVGATTDYEDGSEAIFTVGGTDFTYSATATAAQILAGTHYKDLATLKTAVNNWFNVPANAAAEVGATYNYNNGVFTNSAVGTVADPGLAGTTFTDGDTSGTATTGKTISTSYIQKISKAQGDTKDDAYLPKTVAAYEISKDYYDCGDGDDARSHADEATDWTVINGTLAAIRDNGSNVRVTPINLKKDKVKFQNGLPTGFDADDKVDVYLAEKGDDGDCDTESYSVDVDGNVWLVNEGSIKKFTVGSDFVTKYTCDRSLDQIDVYNDNNLIAWDASGDVYTAVNEGTKVTQDESTAVAPVVVTGWVQGTDGTWTFNDATGAKVASKWINVGGYWYYMKADGIMATGWYNDNGTWYYLNASGAMATGWINDNGTWYYLATSGAMLANTTVDGYKLGASGAWVK